MTDLKRLFLRHVAISLLAGILLTLSVAWIKGAFDYLRQGNPRQISLFTPALQIEHGQGWPFACLEFPYNYRQGYWGEYRLPSSVPYVGGYRMAFRPIWLGLTANTAIYAGLTWMVFFGVNTVRRSSRRREGRCVWCGYQLAGFKSCPECGSTSP